MISFIFHSYILLMIMDNKFNFLLIIKRLMKKVYKQSKRLFFYIMRPAMIFTWVFGLVLIYLNGIDIFSQLWFQIKIVLVILLSAYNDYLGKCLVALKNSTNTRSAKFFRIINEIPTVILIIVVFLAIFKPI